MAILNIRQVVRGGSKALIGIGGVTGSGKTYTALLIARGMVSKPSEIGFLDTENGRGSFYADILDGPFMIADLYPPFSPRRYAEAIKEFQDAGVKVLVIDSVSHEWEGEGGCDDIANLTTGKIANWKLAKSEHKKFMNALLQSNMHVICCIRAREKTDFKNPKEPVSLGIQPVCEKNFMFEMTASVLVEEEGKTQRFLKVPSFLKKTFGDGKNYLGKNTGAEIIEWINTGEKEDPEVTRLRSEMMMICEQGLEVLKREWKKMPPPLLKKMNPHWSVYEASAKGYDELTKMNSMSDSGISLDELQELFEIKKDGLPEEEIINIERILKAKETASYQKLKTLLISK
jgi:hypothetical protein